VVGRPLDEVRLIERAQRGDAAAYEELVRAYQAIAFRTARAIGASAPDAEDAAQEAFVKAWRALPRFHSGSPFRPWLLTIVANEARSRRRSLARRDAAAARAAVAPPAVARSAEDSALDAARANALLAAIARLPDAQREVVALRYLLDLSEAETAKVLRCRPGTVKSRLSRALERLRAQEGAA
jgi:RNA polymerase sigma-70 factor (ECF subfamily)